MNGLTEVARNRQTQELTPMSPCHISQEIGWTVNSDWSASSRAHTAVGEQLLVENGHGLYYNFS
jgi:hypothetical protein